MAIDYNLYPKNWKTEIRPRILARANNCCEQCKVPNYAVICRGRWKGEDVYQNDDGQIFSATDGGYLGSSYVGDIWGEGVKQVVLKVVLTVAHMEHDLSTHEDEDLNALCQTCHLRHDKKLHSENARQTRDKKKGILKLF